MFIKFKSRNQEYIVRASVATLLIFMLAIDYNGHGILYYVSPSISVMRALRICIFIICLWLAYGKLYTPRK
jgi:hypothetical protein